MGIFDFFKKKNTRQNLLIESYSPVCPLKVIIDESNNSTYMYLVQVNDNKEVIEVKAACWLCNHIKAPSDIDNKFSTNGLQPVLSAEFCKHPDGINSLNKKDIEVVWFEEGDGAGVIYQGNILGIIPPWVEDTFPVFASGCSKESYLVLPLIKEDNVLWDRLLKAKQFWHDFDNDFWVDFKDKSLSILENQFGPHVKYYAIDGGFFPPKALVKFEVKGVTYLITLGVSLIPQPTVESYTKTPETKRRIEIALAIETNTFNKNEESILGYISDISKLSWNNFSWLGHGHTISATDIFSSDLTNVLCIGANEYTKLPSIDLPSINGDTTNILWLMPLTEEETNVKKTTGIDAFCEKLKKTNFWVFKE